MMWAELVIATPQDPRRSGALFGSGDRDLPNVAGRVSACVATNAGLHAVDCQADGARPRGAGLLDIFATR